MLRSPTQVPEESLSRHPPALALTPPPRQATGGLVVPRTVRSRLMHILATNFPALCKGSTKSSKRVLALKACLSDGKLLSGNPL